jgi:hypothetical protein
MAWRDVEDLWQDPQALPAGSASQEPPKSAGDAGSTDDARAHHGRDMNRWMGDLHLGSDHGTDTEYNHGGAPPRVIQTIIRDSGNTQWTVLTKTNYVEWSSMMKVMIEARRMWNIVCLGDASRHEDRRPLEALLSAVPPEMIPALSGKVTAKDAWDDIALLGLTVIASASPRCRNSERSGITWYSCRVRTSTTSLYVSPV